MTIKVMIVDDDPAVLMIGKVMLSTLPYAIVGASSGEDAIEKLSEVGEEVKDQLTDLKDEIKEQLSEAAKRIKRKRK